MDSTADNASLTEIKTLYLSVLNSIKLDVVQIDRDYTILMTNSGRKRINISGPEDMIGKKCYRAFHNRENACPNCTCTQAMETGKPTDIETSGELQGQIRSVHIQAFPLFGPNNTIIGCTELVEDITGQKQTQKALRETEIFNASILDNAPNPIIVINPDDTIRYVNPAFTKLTGFSAAEIIDSRPPFPYWPKRYYQQYTLDYLNQQITHFERSYQKKNGKRFWVEVIAKPVIENGALQYYVINWINISERRRFENALKEAEVFNSSILSNAPNPILVTGLDSAIIYVNPALENLTGYSNSELIGLKSPYPWWPPEKLEQFEYENVIGRQKKTINRQERYYLKKNGELFWIALSITAIRDKGKARYYLSNWVNITERKGMEDALKESNEYNSSLLSNSPNPIVVYNPDASIKYINPAFEKLTGFSSSELVGIKPPFPWWPEEGIEQRGKFFVDGLLNSQSRLERLIRNKKREPVHVEITRSAVRDQAGELRFHISIWIDITEQKRLHQNLEFYVAEITRAQEEERKRIARELHDDTAQSLAVLGLEIESISRNKQLSIEDIPLKMEELRSKVSHVLSEVRRFSHELRPGLLDQLGLLPALENLVDEVREAQQIKASFEISGDELRLSADKELLIFRIAQESLNNIRKHSQAKELKFRIRFGEDKVTVIIADNGQGFEVARMLNEAAKQGHLGLIGMQERVRLLGGHLSIKSQKGKGTAVVVSIPHKSDTKATNDGNIQNASIPVN